MAKDHAPKIKNARLGMLSRLGMCNMLGMLGILSHFSFRLGYVILGFGYVVYMVYWA